MSRRLFSALFYSLLGVHQTTAHAAGFGLSEQSGSGLGNAYAGAAAVAEDASTIYFNPAGMTYLQGRQLVGALFVIKPTGHFDNAGSSGTGGEGGDLGDWSLLPNVYYKQDLASNLQFGIGISSPFGLKTEYDRDWIGRFQGVKSELKTININPSLAWKMNDQLSFGAGISAMWARAELSSVANLTGFGLGQPLVTNKGDDWGFGFNLGTIYEITPDTRIGLAYRSKVSQKLEGKSSSSSTAFNALPTRTLNTDITADITLPESLAFSIFSRLNDRWELLTDVTWTRWSQFKTLRVIRDNGSNSVLSSTTEHWNNTLRYSVGLNYRYSQSLKLRTGVAYDQEPIDNNHRTVRIPGNDRTWLSAGLSWQYSPQTAVDVGYAHLFIKDASIRDDLRGQTPSKGLVSGDYSGYADILTVQLSHQF